MECRIWCEAAVCLFNDSQLNLKPIACTESESSATFNIVIAQLPIIEAGRLIQTRDPGEGIMVHDGHNQSSFVRLPEFLRESNNNFNSTTVCSFYIF